MSAVSPRAPEEPQELGPIDASPRTRTNSETFAQAIRASNEELALDLIKERTKMALQKEKPSLGRKVILEQMAKEPNQLLLDITRSPITIGDEPLAKKEGVGAADRLTTVGLKLLDYVSKKNPELGNATVDLIDELLYASVQTFIAASATEAHFAVGTPGDWAADKDKVEAKVTFKMLEGAIGKVFGRKPTTLVISRTSEMSYVHQEGQEKDKKVRLESSCHYDLVQKKAIFHLSYTIDGKTKRCVTDNPLDFNSQIWK